MFALKNSSEGDSPIQPIHVLCLLQRREVFERWLEPFRKHPELFSLTYDNSLCSSWEGLLAGGYDVVLIEPTILLKDAGELMCSSLDSIPCPILALGEDLSESQAEEVIELGAFDCVVHLKPMERFLPRRVLRALREWHYIQERELAKGLFVNGDRHFRMLFDRSLDAMVLVEGSSGKLFDCNEAFMRDFLYQRHEVGQLYFSDLFDDGSGEEELLQKRLRIHGTVIEQQHFKDSIGGRHTMDVTATILSWEGDYAVLVTFRDVSEREEREERALILNDHLKRLNDSLDQRVQRATKELIASNADLRDEVEQRKFSEAKRARLNLELKDMHALVRTIIDSTPDWIYVKDTDFRYRLVNKSMADALKTTPEELIGKTSIEAGFEERDIFGDKEKGLMGFSHYSSRVLESGVPLTNPYESITLGERTEIFEAIRIPLKDSGGAVQGLMCVSRNITQRERVKHELMRALNRERELGELKSDFVNMVSHEFRTPLSAIQSTADLLMDYSDRLTEQKNKGHLNAILTSVRRMSEMMEDFLLLGQIQSGKMAFKPEPFQVKAIWDHLTENFDHHEDSLDRIQVSFDNCEAATVTGDVRLVALIVGNVLSNALKYSEDEVVLRFAVREASLSVKVEDKGIGIPPDEIGKLDKLFYRATNAKQIKGVGVGMFIVKQCLDLHGGKLNCESKEGEGTLFEVFIPIKG